MAVEHIRWTVSVQVLKTKHALFSDPAILDHRRIEPPDRNGPPATSDGADTSIMRAPASQMR
jgi:hypothetical protein